MIDKEQRWRCMYPAKNLILLSLLLLNLTAASAIQSTLPKHIVRWHSLNPSMKIVKLGYGPIGYIVYNSDDYDFKADLDVDKKTAAGDIPYAVLKEPDLKGQKLFENSGMIFRIEYGIYPPMDSVVMFSQDLESAFPACDFCLLSPHSVYLYELTGGDWRIRQRLGYVVKYSFRNGDFRLVPQPFYKLEGKSLLYSNVKIYLNTEEKADEQVGLLAGGTRVDIHGYKKVDGQEWYLLEGLTGIIGWHRLEFLRKEIHSGGPAESGSQGFYEYIYTLGIRSYIVISVP